MDGAKYTPAGNSLRAVAETGWQLPFWDEIRDSQSLRSDQKVPGESHKRRGLRLNGREAAHLSSRSSADQSRTEGEMGKHQEAELRQHHCLTRRATISLISSSDNIDPILHKSEMLVIVGQCESR